MAQGIVYVAEHAKEIMADREVHCEKCGNLQYSLFDRLYTTAYGQCVDCTPMDEYELKGSNILTIIEQTS